MADVKSIDKVEYQIGVDVLGFPIYLQHYIIIGNNKQGYIKMPKFWLRIIQSIVKQH